MGIIYQLIHYAILTALNYLGLSWDKEEEYRNYT